MKYSDEKFDVVLKNLELSIVNGVYKNIMWDDMWLYTEEIVEIFRKKLK